MNVLKSLNAAVNPAALYLNCVNDLVNCTTRQLKQLGKVKDGGKIVNDSSHIVNQLLYNKHWSSIVVIEVLACVGLILCFAGHRLLKLVLFLAGFTIGSLVFYAFSPIIINTSFCCGAKGKKEVHLAFSAVVGLILGILSLRLYRLGVFAVGQCLGLIVALSILCTPLHVYFDNNVSYSIFMATLSCIFGSMTWKHEKPIVVIATSCGGSLAFLYGVDHMAKTSFSVTIESLLFRIKDVIFDGLHSEYTNWRYHATELTHYKALRFQKKAVPMFFIWSVMTVLGIVVQYKWTSKSDDSDESNARPSCVDCLRGSSFSKSDYA